MAAGDFNGNGTADVAVFHRSTDDVVTLHVFWGSKTNTPLGNSQLIRGLSRSQGWDWLRIKMAAGDFNGNGTAGLAGYDCRSGCCAHLQEIWGSKPSTALGHSHLLRGLRRSQGWD